MERIDTGKLSDNVKKLLNPNTPEGLKILAIKGTVPLRPSDYVVFLYLMISDGNEEIKALANKTFSALPPNILSAVLTQPLPAEVINRLSIEYRSDKNVIEKILMNNATADETFEMIATFADEKLIDIIARNQVRILRYPKIIRAICDNPNATASQKSMVLEFAQKSGIKTESLGICAGQKPPEEEIKPEVTAPVPEEDKPADAVNPVTEPEKKEAATPAGTSSNKEELIKKFGIDREYYDESIPLPEEKEKKLIEELEHMDEGRQMALVEVGRHRVKQIMARSAIASVALAAVKHPDITPDDIFKIAQDRAANTEAIKYIATHRDYIRVYNIKLKLALNPKTPVPMAMAFVRSLRLSDLKNIAKNASVSKILQNTAKGIMKMHS